MLIARIVSEIPYKSRITDLEEKLPFAITVMGNAGKNSMSSCSFDCNPNLFRHGSGTDGYDAEYSEGSRCADKAQNW